MGSIASFDSVRINNFISLKLYLYRDVLGNADLLFDIIFFHLELFIAAFNHFVFELVL